MSERVQSALTKALAVLVLAIAAWVLLKIVINVVAIVAWIVAGVLAVLAVMWAVETLRSPAT
jgi:hypothetical protein